MRRGHLLPRQGFDLSRRGRLVSLDHRDAVGFIVLHQPAHLVLDAVQGVEGDHAPARSSGSSSGRKAAVSLVLAPTFRWARVTVGAWVTADSSCRWRCWRCAEPDSALPSAAIPEPTRTIYGNARNFPSRTCSL